MRRALFAITALFLIAGQAQEAAGQCSITVLDLNGTPTLCSDYGDDWRWTGPGGFTSSAMCIDAVTPGTYTLTVYDFATNTWSAPCSHTVGNPPTAPDCAIAGPDSICAGSSVTWCAPSGDFTLAWSGPGGFAASTSCVILAEPGTYSLTVTDAATGMASAPCTRTLRLVDCTPPPPDGKCPAPARWWTSVLGSSDQALAPELQATIAHEVDARSAALEFGETPEGLQEVLAAKRHGRSYHAARRHYAAVLANVAANQLEVTDASGRAIGLSLAMTLDHVPGVPAGTTLAAWVAATEATLGALDEQTCRQRAAREECRRIKAQAREISGAGHRTACPGLAPSMFADDDGDDFDGLGDRFEPTMTTVGSGSGGSSGKPTRLRWTMQRADEVTLDVLDLSGRRVRTFVRGAYAAGTHEQAWDGRSDSGEPLRPGAYFVAGRIGGVRLAQKLILFH